MLHLNIDHHVVSLYRFDHCHNVIVCDILMLQLRVTVHDTGNSDKSATTAVRIPVTRNVNSPKFDKQNYKSTINENVNVGHRVLKVTATDADKVGVNLMRLFNIATKSDKLQIACGQGSHWLIVSLT